RQRGRDLRELSAPQARQARSAADPDDSSRRVFVAGTSRTRMSLRLRLLLAVGAVALIALVVADVVTYRSLKSFMYDRVDESLASTQEPLQQLFGPGPGGGF